MGHKAQTPKEFPDVRLQGRPLYRRFIKSVEQQRKFEDGLYSASDRTEPLKDVANCVRPLKLAIARGGDGETKHSSLTEQAGNFVGEMTDHERLQIASGLIRYVGAIDRGTGYWELDPDLEKVGLIYERRTRTVGEIKNDLLLDTVKKFVENIGVMKSNDEATIGDDTLKRMLAELRGCQR